MAKIDVAVKASEYDYVVNTDLTIGRIKQIASNGRDRKFFIKMGARQRDTSYRGCVISHFTTTYSNGSKVRQHVPYLFCSNRGAFHCLATCNLTLQQAKKVIDSVLETKNGSMRKFNILGSMEPVNPI
jgi:hypothetical protein